MSMKEMKEQLEARFKEQEEALLAKMPSWKQSRTSMC